MRVKIYYRHETMQDHEWRARSETCDSQEVCRDSMIFIIFSLFELHAKLLLLIGYAGHLLRAHEWQTGQVKETHNEKCGQGGLEGWPWACPLCRWPWNGFPWAWSSLAHWRPAGNRDHQSLQQRERPSCASDWIPSLQLHNTTKSCYDIITILMYNKTLHVHIITSIMPFNT